MRSNVFDSYLVMTTVTWSATCPIRMCLTSLHVGYVVSCRIAVAHFKVYRKDWFQWICKKPRIAESSVPSIVKQTKWDASRFTASLVGRLFRKLNHTARLCVQRPFWRPLCRASGKVINLLSNWVYQTGCRIAQVHFTDLYSGCSTNQEGQRKNTS